MTRTALRSARQSAIRHRKQDGAAGPLTRMTRDQAPTGRQATEPRLTRLERVDYNWCLGDVVGQVRTVEPAT